MNGCGLWNKDINAYRANHSKTIALVNMTERWLDNIEDKKQSISTFLDLSVVFDCVEYSTLVDKMTIYGFSAKTMGLIRNYLVGRTQVVTFGTRSRSH